MISAKKSTISVVMVVFFLASIVSAHHLVVRPQEASLNPGESFKFDAVMYTDQNQPLHMNQMVWRVEPADLGKITADGFFVAGPQPGQGEVIASSMMGHEEVIGKAKVRIGQTTEPDIRIIVRPEKAIVPPLGKAQFTALAVGPDGASLRIQGVRWMVEPKILGLINPDGAFIAGPLIAEGCVVALADINGQNYRGQAKVIVSQPAESALQGTVRDVAGVFIADASIQAVRLSIPLFTQNAKSDENGRYQIGKLIPGVYVLRAEKPGYISQYYLNTTELFKATSVKVAEKDTVSNIDFTLSSGGSISGHVYSEDGTTPLAGVHVMASHTDSPDQRVHTLSTEDGSYKLVGLVSGTYLVHAEKEGFVGEFYQDALRPDQATRVEVVEPNEKNGIDFALALKSAITGIVTNEKTGTPICGATVMVYDLIQHPGRIQIAKQRALTNENGVYTIGVKPGFYLLHTIAEGFVPEWFDNITEPLKAKPVQVFEMQHTTADMALAPLGALSGKVTNEMTKEPIAGATVRAFAENKLMKRSFESFTHDDGAFQFAALPAGKYVVVADARDYLPEFWQEADSVTKSTPVEIMDGITVDNINFTLNTGGIIKGLVIDAESTLPLAEAVVTVMNQRNRSLQTAKTNAAGQYSIEGLSSGFYYFNASALNYVPQWYDSVTTRKEAHLVSVTAPSMVEDIDFQLSKLEPRPRSISGTVIDDSTNLPIQNASIVAMPVRNFSKPGRAFTDADGKYFILDLEPGTYVIMGQARHYIGEFYKDAKSWKQAAVIDIRRGEEVVGIDFGLAPQHVGVYTVAGRVISTSNSVIGNALISLESNDQVVATTSLDDDGAFYLSDVPADAYSLTVSAAGFSDALVASASPIQVGDGKNSYSALLTLTPSTTTYVISTATAPTTFALEQNYPNPFNPTTEIKFHLATAAHVRLQIFNLLGEEVKILRDRDFAAGNFSAIWDGADNYGQKMASGVYLYRLEANYGNEHFIQIHRMLMIK